MTLKSYNELVEELNEIDGPSRSHVLEQWTLGKDFIVIEAQLQFHVFGDLPLRINIIGHCSMTRVCLGLAACILLFENMEEGSETHEAVLELFGVNSPHRELVDGVIASTIDIATTPRLMWYRLRSKFAKKKRKRVSSGWTPRPIGTDFWHRIIVVRSS